MLRVACSSQREHLQHELDKVRQQVREAGSDRKEAKREARMTEAVAALKKLYPHGERPPSIHLGPRVG